MTTVINDSEQKHGSAASSKPSRRDRTIRVSLYGGLSRLMPTRPAILTVPDDATVGWVVDELVRRLGTRFSDRILQSPNRKRYVCRIFLDGLSVDLDDRLPPGEAANDLELIMLTAVEGG